MSTKKEITKKFGREYARSSKKVKGRLLDEVTAAMGWSRANARRQLRAAAVRSGHASAVKRKPRARTYGYDTLKVLQLIWTLIGEPCGKYLAPIMADTLAKLERFGELEPVASRLDDHVRAQLVTMSPATIDRLLKPAKDARYPTAKSATRAGTMLRSSITVRQAMDEMEKEPGFFEIDLVAHFGHSLKGEFARTLNLTDVHTGWVFTRTVRNNAHVHILGALKAGVEKIPFEVTGLDFDNADFLIMPTLIRESLSLVVVCQELSA